MRKRITQVAVVALGTIIIVIYSFLSTVVHNPSEDEKDPTFIGIITLQDDQFQRLLQIAMKKQAERLGVDVVMTNSGSQLANEVEWIEKYVNMGVDGLLVSPVSKEESAAALERAAKQGVTVYPVHMSMDSDWQAGYIEMDQQDLGETTGKACREYIENKLGGKAKVGILQFKTQLKEMSSSRTEGFLSQIRNVPGVEVVADIDAWLLSSGVTDATEMIQANPDLDIIWSANEGGTMSAVLAVRNTGNAGKIAVFGTDSGELIANMLLDDDNILQFVTGQDPDTMGKAAMNNIYKSIKGMEIDKSIVLQGIALSRERPNEVLKYLDSIREKLEDE